jgi:hypothetical protein
MLIRILILIQFATLSFNNFLQAQGKLTVAPLSMRAGTLQEINYTFVVGKNGIKPGGGIRIEMPIAYAETEFLYWSKPQVKQSGDLGYTIVRTSNNANVKLVDHGMVGGVLDVLLIDKALSENDQITIQYKGKVQSISGRTEIRTAIRQSEKDQWQKQNTNLFLNILPTEASNILINYPSDIRINDFFDVTLVAIDKFGNPASNYTGSLKLLSNVPIITGFTNLKSVIL